MNRLEAILSGRSPAPLEKFSQGNVAGTLENLEVGVLKLHEALTV